MRTRTGTVFLAAALALAASLLGGCIAHTTVAIDNQSGALLNVTAALPARGLLGMRANSEAFGVRLEPGSSWASSPDTPRSSAPPNTSRSVRLHVIDDTNPDRPIAYAAEDMDSDGNAYKIRFRGERGKIVAECLSKDGAVKSTRTLKNKEEGGDETK